MKILDSLAHPTISGKWLGKELDSSFDTLVRELVDADYIGACAIGIAGVGGYSHEAFIDRCHEYESLIPVAGVDRKAAMSPEREFKYLKQLGYRAVKIHPRFSGYSDRLEDLAHIIEAAATSELVIFYCTYMHCEISRYPDKDPFYSLVYLLKLTPSAKIVLVHGGDVNVLRYAELVRFNPNLLLDLSLTLRKYEGSSIDQDIRFLFAQFDRRVCIGTDFPEYSHKSVRTRFEALAHDVPINKQENIAHKNLIDFLRM